MSLDDGEIRQRVHRHLDALGRLAPALDEQAILARESRSPALDVARAMVGVVVLFAVVVVAGPLVLSRAVPPRDAASAPVVRIAPGISPHLTPAMVEAAALDRIHAMEQFVGDEVAPARIVEVTATTLGELNTVLPGRSTTDPRSGDAETMVWLVTAEGTFSNSRTPPGATPLVAGSGYFVFLDEDGSVLDFGFPDPTR